MMTMQVMTILNLKRSSSVEEKLNVQGNGHYKHIIASRKLVLISRK